MLWCCRVGRLNCFMVSAIAPLPTTPEPREVFLPAMILPSFPSAAFEIACKWCGSKLSMVSGSTLERPIVIDFARPQRKIRALATNHGPGDKFCLGTGIGFGNSKLAWTIMAKVARARRLQFTKSIRGHQGPVDYTHKTLKKRHTGRPRYAK